MFKFVGGFVQSGSGADCVVDEKNIFVVLSFVLDKDRSAGVGDAIFKGESGKISFILLVALI